MELQPRTTQASDSELATIARVIQSTEYALEGKSDATRQEGGERFRRSGESMRTLLLPALHALQDDIGWISQGAVEELSEQLRVPRADIYGVASFYALLNTEPSAQQVVHVCEDMACRMAGSRQLMQQFQDQQLLEPKLPEPELLEPQKTNTPFLRTEVHGSPCLGHCELKPVAYITQAGAGRKIVAEATPEKLAEALAVKSTGTSLTTGTSTATSAPAPKIKSIGEPRLLKRMLEKILETASDAASPDMTAPVLTSLSAPTLDEYLASGGYEALHLAISNGPEWVLENIRTSQLRGRGGAAFPTGVKWQAVADAGETPCFVVANADESEPGTFKDRLLMEWDPFTLLEAMTIAAFVAGAERGYIYVRDEYPLAQQRLLEARSQAMQAGYLGHNPVGADFDFHIELRRGAGAYICGEETALFNSIEGYRGEPRSKPPFPTQFGLFGKPTLINNVETFANIPQILNMGGPAFAQVGSHDSVGTRLFCVSGDCQHPGTYEAPLGTTLERLLQEAEVAPGSRVLLGGAAGAFVAPDQHSVELSFEGATAANLTLGSGAVIVMGPDADMNDMLFSIADFFVKESCGQCVPCRVGTVHQKETLVRLGVSGEQRSSDQNSSDQHSRDLALMEDLDAVMTDASICGLGQTAASALRSARRLAYYAAEDNSQARQQDS